MTWITLILLSVILGFAAVQRAAVDPHDWNICLVAIGILSVLHFAIPPRKKTAALDRTSASIMAAFVALVGFQLVPLPISLIRILSPARAELAVATAMLDGAAPRYTGLSVAPEPTTEYVLTIVGCTLIFLLVRDLALRTREAPWIVSWPLLAIGALEAVLGIYQSNLMGQQSRASGTYASPDHYAALLEMILPIPALYAAAVLLRQDRRHSDSIAPALQASALLSAAAAMLVGIIFSLSRMGFLVVLATIFLAAAAGIALRKGPIEHDRPVSRWRWAIPLPIVAVVVILAFIYLPTDPLVWRFADLAKTEDISADTRAQIWRDTSGLIKAFPWFGCGLGAYESGLYQFKTAGPMNTVDYAHNDFLQILAETGIVGFLLSALFVGRLMLKTARTAAWSRSLDRRFSALASIAAIVAILLHSLVDFNLYVPANDMAFAWILGVAGANLRREPADKPAKDSLSYAVSHL